MSASTFASSQESWQHIANVYFSVEISLRNMLQALLLLYFKAEIRVHNMLQALLSYIGSIRTWTGRSARASSGTTAAAFGKREMGSALMGSLQIACFLTEGLFGYSRFLGTDKY